MNPDDGLIAPAGYEPLGTIELQSDCIVATNGWDRNGYRRVRVGGRDTTAHRQAWINKHGPISKGLMVCHHCDNRACINLDHLFLGTAQDNVRDMVLKGRHDRQQRTKCPLGHPLIGPNVRLSKSVSVVTGKPRRDCKICAYASSKKRIPSFVGTPEWEKIVTGFYAE